MKLLRSILSSPWMIEPGAMRAYLPLAARLLAGEDVRFYNEPTPRFCLVNADGDPYDDDMEDEPRDMPNYEAAPANSIAVYPITGVITKYDQLCGPAGTITLMDMMRKADASERVIGHFLEIDSGGGEATNIETVARFIREEIKKPVVAYVNGVCASAAYYIAAAADKIYASEPTDIFGSIGVLLNFVDMIPYLEKEGYKVHEVYADQSDLKNLDFRQAREGDYKPLKEKLLNPYAATFISTIQEYRPGLSEESAYRGEIFTTADAIRIGMIDGIMTRKQALAEVSNIQKNTLMQNAISQFSAILGYELQMQDGGVFLNQDELAQLSQHVAPEGYQAVEVGAIEQINSRIDQISTRLDELQTELQAAHAAGLDAQVSINALEHNFEAWKKEPATPPTAAFTMKDPDEPGEPDELEKLEAAARAAAEAGGRAVFIK